MLKLPRARQAHASRKSVIAFGRKAAKNADRKGKSDALKTKVYGKFGKLILQAAKAGGDNPDTNAKLKSVMTRARSAGVPNDIIDRNLKRAGDKSAADLAEHLIEVYGPGGSGFIMDCLTDNRQRAATDIWTIVKKQNGKMAEAGSVLFNFERRGEIALTGVSEDEAFDAAMDAAGEDVEPLVGADGGVAGYKVVSTVDNFGKARDALDAMSVTIDDKHTGLAFKALATVAVEDEEAHGANVEIYERCLQLDDVDAVYTNCADVGMNA